MPGVGKSDINGNVLRGSPQTRGKMLSPAAGAPGPWPFTHHTKSLRWLWARPARQRNRKPILECHLWRRGTRRPLTRNPFFSPPRLMSVAWSAGDRAFAAKLIVLSCRPSCHVEANEGRLVMPLILSRVLSASETLFTTS